MGFSADDPKWTAYVLGELSPDEQADIEREMAESPEARREVAEIRRAVQAIGAELKTGISTDLKTGTSPGLTAAQREAIRRAPAATAPSPVSLAPTSIAKRPFHPVLYACATAAGLACIALWLSQPQIQQARRSARTDTFAKSDSSNAASSPGGPPSADSADTREGKSQSQGGQQGQNKQMTEYQFWSPTDEPVSDQTDYSTSDYPNGLLQDAAEQSLRGYVGKQKVSGSAGGAVSGPSSRGAGAGAAGTGVSGATPGLFGGGTALGEVGGGVVGGGSRAKAGEFTGGQAFGGRGVAARSSSFGFNGSTKLNRSGVGPQDRVAIGEKQLDGPRTYMNAPADAIGGPGPGAMISDKDVPPGLRANLGPVPSERRADPYDRAGGEGYDPFVENAFLAASENPLSTFSIDVDTASYSIMRRYLTVNRQLPPKSAVRVEEMINYFHYDYPQPEGNTPFSANVEVAGCPWNAAHRLVRVGLKGKDLAAHERPASNLVFLIDVSGSMAGDKRLPLVKRAMKLLLDQLRENDRVAIVVYAGEAGLVLPSTSAVEREPIIQAIDRLQASGSTNGGEGIQLAYRTALKNFVKGGTNRVILATDGDFNVGTTDRTELVALVTAKAKQGVFLTALGFGMGNFRDDMLVQLADRGNGNYAYIDDFQEARKVFVEQLAGTLVTIAKDVKIQIEFNPAKVASYRLIGYEKRALRNEDFNNDKKDAGEIGAGHSVTALYELVPVGVEQPRPAVDPLKYQQRSGKTTDTKPRDAHAEDVGPAKAPAEASDELLALKLRYKQPEGDTSKLIEVAARDSGGRYAQASGDFKFAASVALFGMILRDSQFRGDGTLSGVTELAQEGIGRDEGGHRAEFLKLVEAAKQLQR